jgi:hypothetical protein
MIRSIAILALAWASGPALAITELKGPTQPMPAWAPIGFVLFWVAFGAVYILVGSKRARQARARSASRRCASCGCEIADYESAPEVAFWFLGRKGSEKLPVCANCYGMSRRVRLIGYSLFGSAVLLVVAFVYVIS